VFRCISRTTIRSFTSLYTQAVLPIAMADEILTDISSRVGVPRNQAYKDEIDITIQNVTDDTSPTMSAIIYKQLNEVELVRRPKPQIQAPGDAIVKVLHASICGTDLHILQGHVPTCQPGRILGHEGVGIIESLGAGVTTLAVGTRVLIACISSCGVCTPCRGGLSAHCSTGGWILGHTIDGTQAEYVRVPHAACSLFPLQENIGVKAALPLSDSVPTAYDVGLLPGNIKPGAKVAIIGAGPVALALLMLAKLYSPKCVVVIGRGESRLETAKQLGADHVFSTLNGEEAAIRGALEVSGGVGFDLVSECVGAPESFNVCQRLLATGGTLTNAGVHGCQVTFDLHQLWSKNISTSFTVPRPTHKIIQR
jgi:alcohol dehydrogenase